MTTAIDIGETDGTGWNNQTGYNFVTEINSSNPVNATGVITKLQITIKFIPASYFYYGIFYNTGGANYTARYWSSNIYASLQSTGNITLSGLNISVVSGDCIGFYASSDGCLFMNTVNGGGVYYVLGQPPVGQSNTFTLHGSNFKIAIGGWGHTRPTLSGFSASENNNTQVNLGWTNIDATVTNLYRDSSYIYQANSSTNSYADTAAAAPTITGGSTVASDGASTAHVSLSLSGTTSNNGTTYTYSAIPFYLSNGTYIHGATYSDTGYRLAGSLSYLWYRSAADSDASYSSLGITTSTHNDTGAPTPTITGGSTVASDGASTVHVALSLTGTVNNDGEGRYYKCYLTAPSASAVYSAANRGYRAAGTLTYQWQRSEGDDGGDGSALAIIDGGLESWTDATHLTNWILGQDGTGGALDQEATEKKVGTYSAKVTVGTAASYLAQSLGTTYNGKKITIGCWCKSANSIANRVVLLIYDTVGGSIVNRGNGYYQNTGGWEYLTATIFVDAANANVGIQLRCSTGANAPAYFDAVSGAIGIGVWDGANGLTVWTNLGGATSSTYNDQSIPYPEARYYRCYLTASPATPVASSANRGYIPYIPRIIYL